LNENKLPLKEKIAEKLFRWNCEEPDLDWFGGEVNSNVMEKYRDQATLIVALASQQSKCPDNWLDLDALQDAGRLSQDVASSVEEMPAVLEPRAAASDAATAAHKYVQSVIDNADVWTEEWAENVFIAGWRQATSQASGPMMTAHGEGADTTLHPTDRPCAKCRPPVVITDAMVERANKAYCDALYEAADGSPKALGHWADHHPARNVMRAALEAALNG
jgi:hypothetical protein